MKRFRDDGSNDDDNNGVFAHKTATLNSKLEAIFDEINKPRVEIEKQSWTLNNITKPPLISQESRKVFEEKVKEMHRLEDELVSSCPKGTDGKESEEEIFLELFFQIKLPDPPNRRNIIQYNNRLDSLNRRHTENEPFYNKFNDLLAVKEALGETLSKCFDLSYDFNRHEKNYFHDNDTDKTLLLTQDDFEGLKNWLTHLWNVSGLHALKSDISYLQKMIDREPPRNFVTKLFEIMSHAMTAFNRYLAHLRFDWKVARKEKERAEPAEKEKPEHDKLEKAFSQFDGTHVQNRTDNKSDAEEELNLKSKKGFAGFKRNSKSFLNNNLDSDDEDLVSLTNGHRKDGGATSPKQKTPK